MNRGQEFQLDPGVVQTFCDGAGVLVARVIADDGDPRGVLS